MNAHAKRAMAYVLVVAITLVGSWSLLGRETEVEAASVPLAAATEPTPLIFEAGDHTCVYIGGQLECFCSCPGLQASASAPLVVHAEPQVIAIPGGNAGSRELLSGSGGSAEEIETTTRSPLPERTPVFMSRSDDDDDDDDDRDDSDERPACNQGVGNGPEGCDPGNSNNNQPSNDEEGGTPGNPGRQGGQNRLEGQSNRPPKPDTDD